MYNIFASVSNKLERDRPVAMKLAARCVNLTIFCTHLSTSLILAPGSENQKRGQDAENEDEENKDELPKLYLATISHLLRVQSFE
jgi:hypothetical protein